MSDFIKFNDPYATIVNVDHIQHFSISHKEQLSHKVGKIYLLLTSGNIEIEYYNDEKIFLKDVECFQKHIYLKTLGVE